MSSYYLKSKFAFLKFHMQQNIKKFKSYYDANLAKLVGAKMWTEMSRYPHELNNKSRRKCYLFLSKILDFGYVMGQIRRTCPLSMLNMHPFSANFDEIMHATSGDYYL